MTVAVLTSGLISCGGGSNSPGNTSPSTTIDYLNPIGIVASTSTRSVSIYGKNFANGMTVSVTDKAGTTNYLVGTPVVSSSTEITVNVNTTATVPTDNYVNVTVKSSSGTTLATAILGVASAPISLATDVQSIFDAHCIACHDGSGPSFLDLRSSASVYGLINASSSLCSNKLRVTPGDPRRSSSVLIDKILASSGQPACHGDRMPLNGPALSPADIQTIIDWVAGGAN